MVKSLYKMINNSVENLKNLLSEAKLGNSNAFGDIYNNYFVPIYRYVYLRVGRNKETAEEITQDVFLRVFNNLENLKITEANPVSYFFTTARNIVIDFYRKNGRERTIISEVLEEIKDAKQDIENFVEKSEESKMIKEAIKTLTDDQQEIITLKFINELENKEIAELIGKKEEAIRQLQHRALENLREHFNKHPK